MTLVIVLLYRFYYKSFMYIPPYTIYTNTFVTIVIYGKTEQTNKFKCVYMCVCTRRKKGNNSLIKQSFQNGIE